MCGINSIGSFISGAKVTAYFLMIMTSTNLICTTANRKPEKYERVSKHPQGSVNSTHTHQYKLDAQHQMAGNSKGVVRPSLLRKNFQD